MLVRQHAREIGLRSGEFTEAAPGVAEPQAWRWVAERGVAERWVAERGAGARGRCE